jgi:hypothetical protein
VAQLAVAVVARAVLVARLVVFAWVALAALALLIQLQAVR